MHAFRIAFLCGLVALAQACSQAPEDPLEPVRQMQAAGRFAASIDPLRAILDEDPSQAEASFMLGVALSRTGQQSLAIWPLRRAAESPEFALDAGLLLARAMLDSRTATDAVEAVDAVLAIVPDNVNALVLRAQAYLASGKTDEGLADIDRVLELDPDNLAVLVPRVTALIASEQIEEAEAALETARERLEETEEDVPPGMRERLCIARGLFAFEKGDHDAARAQYEKCLEEYPADSLVVMETVAFHDRLREPERATEILRSAFESSKRPVFRVALARRVGAQGDTDEQLRLLREDAETRGSSMAWFALADFHVQRQEFEPALEAFEKSLAAGADPGPKLRFAYADTLVQAEQYAKARQVASELEQPQLSALIRGRILLAEGDARGALEALEEGIRLWPNNAAGRYLAGLAAERIGDFDRAVSEYRESIRADASVTRAGLDLARLYEARGLFADGIGVAGRHASTHRRDPEGYLVTVRLAHRAKRHDVAAEGLRLLALIPGQAAVAVAEEAVLIASDRGTELAIAAIEQAELDLVDPVNVPALRALVRYLGSQGEHARALGAAQAAVAAHADEPSFQEILGHSLQGAGELEKAEAAYERALELDAAHVETLLALAELAAAANDAARALSLFERAAEADPSDVAAALRAAELLAASGDTAGARARLEGLLEHRPSEGKALVALARQLVAAGERDRATEVLESAVWLRAPSAEQMLSSLQGPPKEAALPAEGKLE